MTKYFNFIIHKFKLSLYYLFSEISSLFKFNSSVSILISTTKGYSNKTIPIIYKNLLSQGFKESNIFIFEGNNCNEEITYGFTNYYKVIYNAFDLTALIGYLDKKLYNDLNGYCLLIHDTVEITSDFNRRFHSQRLRSECYRINSGKSMNIGFYKISYLINNLEYLLSFKNYCLNELDINLIKTKAVNDEDFLLDNCVNKIVINQLISYKNTVYNATYFNQIRICEDYKNLGIKKFKANYEIKDKWIVGLF